MATIITYDLSGSQSQVKKDMIEKKGYQVSFNHKNSSGNSGVVYLPETTLYHQTKTPSQAHEDLKEICSIHKCYIRRAIAVELNNWSGEWGNPI